MLAVSRVFGTVSTGMQNDSRINGHAQSGVITDSRLTGLACYYVYYARLPGNPSAFPQAVNRLLFNNTTLIRTISKLFGQAISGLLIDSRLYGQSMSNLQSIARLTGEIPNDDLIADYDSKGPTRKEGIDNRGVRITSIKWRNTNG